MVGNYLNEIKIQKQIVDLDLESLLNNIGPNGLE